MVAIAAREKLTRKPIFCQLATRSMVRRRIRADISQVFCAPTSSASIGPERRVSTKPGGQLCAPSSIMMPRRPTALPFSMTRGTAALR